MFFAFQLRLESDYFEMNNNLLILIALSYHAAPLKPTGLNPFRYINDMANTELFLKLGQSWKRFFSPFSMFLSSYGN